MYFSNSPSLVLCFLRNIGYEQMAEIISLKYNFMCRRKILERYFNKLMGRALLIVGIIKSSQGCLKPEAL